MYQHFQNKRVSKLTTTVPIINNCTQNKTIKYRKWKYVSHKRIFNTHIKGLATEVRILRNLRMLGSSQSYNVNYII